MIQRKLKLSKIPAMIAIATKGLMFEGRRKYTCDIRMYKKNNNLISETTKGNNLALRIIMFNELTL